MPPASDFLAYAQLGVWTIACLAMANMPARDNERSFIKVVVFLWAIANILAANNWLSETHMSGVRYNWLAMRSLAVFTGALTTIWAVRYSKPQV